MYVSEKVSKVVGVVNWVTNRGGGGCTVLYFNFGGKVLDELDKNWPSYDNMCHLAILLTHAFSTEVTEYNSGIRWSLE